MYIYHGLINYIIYRGKIQHSMLAFHKENTSLLNNKFQVIVPTTVLASFVNIKFFVSDVYMDDISDMTCKLHHFHLEHYFIQKQQLKQV